MNRISLPAAEAPSAQPTARRNVMGRLLIWILCLIAAAAAWVAHEHFRLHGQPTPALLSLVAAGLLALVPLRALLGGIFAIERRTLHVLHGVGGGVTSLTLVRPLPENPRPSTSLPVPR